MSPPQLLSYAVQHPVHLALVAICLACGSSAPPQQAPANAARPIGDKPAVHFKKPFAVVMLPYALEHDVAVDGSVTYGQTGAGSPRELGGKFEGPGRYVSSPEPGRTLVVEVQGDIVTFNGKVTGYHLGADGAVTDESRRVVARLAAGRLVSETQSAGCVVSDVDPQDIKSAMLLILAMFADGDSTSVTLC